MLASIVIVTYGQRDLTEQCLRSLEGCLGERIGRDWEIILVDNASLDDTPALLNSWSDRATVRLLDVNRNFAGGCNVGAELATGDVLVFLNNDTEVLPGSLETLVEQALEPGVGVAGCRLLFPDGTVQHGGVAFLHGQALGGVAMPQHVFHGEGGEHPAVRVIYETDCVTAACMAVRASTFRAVGSFDEGYRNGLEDVDLCLKIRAAGERVVYRGDATVIHHEGASRGQGADLWATPAKREAARHNDELFVSRWAAHLDQDDELAADLWDAVLVDLPPDRSDPTADIVIVGQPSGIGPASGEARALLAVLASFGRVPAALDSPVAKVQARLSGPMAALVRSAQARDVGVRAEWVFLPGRHDRYELCHPSIVRLAQPRVAVALTDANLVWAASAALADQLLRDGLPADRLRVVPPPVLPAPMGSGGAGVLAVLPVHEPALAEQILSALRSLPTGTAVRLLPTVFRRKLDEDIREHLPGAELLRPCSDEARFATLAASADVVVAIDPADLFERRALVAAGVGATTITGDPTGPAASVLGPGIASELPSLASSLACALAESGDRSKPAALVARWCGPKAFPEHVAAETAAVARPR